ncbi:MAG TPA: branched-chain amino acid ABC transporter permease [Xanthobacteraceae bacterium]|nr:branched-chain amino acid ABC transporter permease [Xanthobacteraceae bacterium]
MATRRSGYFKTSYAADLTLFDTPFRKSAILALIAVALTLPAVLSQQSLHILNLTMVAIIGAIALNLLTGLAGQLSLGHAAFLATGGFMSHYFSKLGLPFPAVVVLATAIGGVLGFLIGTPALRVRGLYLVLTTVGFHYVVIFLTHVYQASGESSIAALTGFLMPPAAIGPIVLGSTQAWYYFFLLITALVTAYSLNLLRSRIGRAWIALRTRDIIAAALGVNLAAYKLKAFVVSSALTAMAGSLLVYYLGSISAEYYTLDLAISYVAMIVIGGAGSIIGSYLGAIFISLLPYAITWLFHLANADPRVQLQLLVPSQTILFGVLMILFLLFEPLGLVGIWNRIRTYFELWPLRRSILAERRD